MTQFEYISVLVSIVLALGLTEVLVCWVRLLQRREHVKFSWLHGFWNYRTVETWSLFGLFLIVLSTAALVVSALSITPGRNFPDGLDLEQLFLDNAWIFFLMAMIMISLVSILDARVLGIELFSLENTVRAFAVTICLTGAFTKSKKYIIYYPLSGPFYWLCFYRLSVMYRNLAYYRRN